MNRLCVSFLLITAFTACRSDETVRRYGAEDATWVLTELDGHPFTASATLTFPERGRIAGAAPCNSYSGAMTAPYPWFDATGIAATKRACPDLEAETQFFDALSQAQLSEVLGDTLVLSTTDGLEMVFTARH